MSSVFVVVSHVEETPGSFSSMNIRAFAEFDTASAFAKKLKALIKPGDNETIEIDELSLVEQ